MRFRVKFNEKFYLVIFQLCIVVNSVLGEEATFYRLANASTFVFFLSVILLIYNNGWKLKAGAGLYASLLFLTYTFLSLLWSVNIQASMHQCITQIQLYLLIFFTYQLFIWFNRIDRYLDALYISGFAMIVFALYRYGGIKAYLAIMNSGARLGEGIANENAFGLVFSNAAIVALYYAILKGKKSYLIPVPVFTFFALSSGSRKAAILILIGAIGTVVLKYGIRKAYKYVLLFPLILVIGYFVLQLDIFSTINTRLQAYMFGGIDYSVLNRSNMIEFAVELFKQKPLFGYGLTYFSVRYGTYSHNNFTELLVSFGIVGTAIYYMMYILPISRLVRREKNKNSEEWKQYEMLFFLLIVDIVFGWGMVQLYGKRSMFLIGIALATYDSLRQKIHIQRS